MNTVRYLLGIFVGVMLTLTIGELRGVKCWVPDNTFSFAPSTDYYWRR